MIEIYSTMELNSKHHRNPNVTVATSPVALR